MPRKARIISESRIYHVILRGINRQQIFEDREDFEKLEQSKQVIQSVNLNNKAYQSDK